MNIQVHTEEKRDAEVWRNCRRVPRVGDEVLLWSDQPPTPRPVTKVRWSTDRSHTTQIVEVWAGDVIKEEQPGG